MVGFIGVILGYFVKVLRYKEDLNFICLCGSILIMYGVGKVALKIWLFIEFINYIEITWSFSPFMDGITIKTLERKSLWLGAESMLRINAKAMWLSIKTLCLRESMRKHRGKICGWSKAKIISKVRSWKTLISSSSIWVCIVLSRLSVWMDVWLSIWLESLVIVLWCFSRRRNNPNLIGTTMNLPQEDPEAFRCGLRSQVDPVLLGMGFENITLICQNSLCAFIESEPAAWALARAGNYFHSIGCPILSNTETRIAWLDYKSICSIVLVNFEFLGRIPFISRITSFIILCDCQNLC